MKKHLKIVTIFFILSLSSFITKTSKAINEPTNEPIATTDEVVVVYNASYTTDSNTNGIQDSQEIAEYYRDARSIPEVNVMSITAPTTEVISRSDYNTHVKAEIEAYLTANDLASTTKYIVLVKGVPLKISATNGTSYASTNYSSVDSAVCLLYETYSTTWIINNPYYNKDYDYDMDYRFNTDHFTGSDRNGDPFTLRYLVTRLDGYTLQNVKDMIDRGVNADTTESAYWIIDDHPNSGTGALPYATNYDSMQTAHNYLSNLGMNINPDPYSNTTTRITTTTPSGQNIIGYVSHGIYSGFGNDYVSNDLDFNFANGAVFSSYESFNAYGFLNAGQSTHGQLGEWIQVGGSGGIGNVYEPWTTTIPEESMWMPLYAVGYTWADAAYMSLHYIDFVQVVLGDPLMIIADLVAPGQISDLTATTTDTYISMSWTNPVDEDLTGVKVVRKTDDYSTDETDGTLICTVASTTASYCQDDNTLLETDYYYTLFTYDDFDNYSTPDANVVTTTKISLLPEAFIIGNQNETASSTFKIWQWGSTDPGSTFRYIIDQDPDGVPSGEYSGTITATQSEGEGTYYLHVQAKDEDENETEVVTASAILGDVDLVVFEETFGGSDQDKAYDIQQTLEGGYIITGETYSFGGDDSDIYLIKTDIDGAEEWSQIIDNDSNYEEAHSVQQTSDGGYIVVGYTYSSLGSNDDNIYLIKTDSDGEEEWSQIYDNEGNAHSLLTNKSQAYDVQQTSDGGYIISGMLDIYPYLLKVDSTGNKEWSKIFESDEEGYLYAVQQTSDGGYIAGGNLTISSGAGGTDAYIIKVGSNGAEEWSRMFGGSNDDSFSEIYQTSDGGYIAGGYNNPSSSYSYLVKINSTGTEEWSQVIEGALNSEINSLQQTSDGGYILAIRNQVSGRLFDVYLTKTDSSGDEEWTQNFGGLAHDLPYKVQQTTDGGYILAGYTASQGNGSLDVYLIKTNSLGYIDITSPVITEITSSASTTTSTITWTTDEEASSKIYYGLTTDYGTYTTEEDTDTRVTDHSVEIESLDSCTTYHYQVISTDASSNTTTSTDNSFITTGCDATAPTASPVAGTYHATQNVSLTATGSTAICYTRDDTIPACANSSTCTTGTVYSSTLSITSTDTIKSIACYIDGSSGPVSTDTYTLTCSTSSVANGSIGAYPDCTITCDSGYTLNNGACEASGGGGGGGGGGGSGVYIPPVTTPSSVSVSNNSLSLLSTQTGTLTQTFSNNIIAKVEIPVGAVSSPTTFSVSSGSLVGGLKPIDTAEATLIGDTIFNIDAYDASNQAMTSFSNNLTMTFTIPNLNNNSDLGVYYFNENSEQWLLIPDTEFDLVNNKVNFNINHLTRFAIFQITGLPAVIDTDEGLVVKESFWTSGRWVKTEDKTTVYFVDNSNERHSYPNQKIWESYFREDFSFVETISKEELASYPLERNVPYQTGSLFKISSIPKVYRVGDNRLIQWIASEEKAIELYGDNWATLVHDLPDAFFGDYVRGEDLI
jgi:uncharacterized protein (TIGR03790 family)